VITPGIFAPKGTWGIRPLTVSEFLGCKDVPEATIKQLAGCPLPGGAKLLSAFVPGKCLVAGFSMVNGGGAGSTVVEVAEWSLKRGRTHADNFIDVDDNANGDVEDDASGHRSKLSKLNETEVDDGWEVAALTKSKISNANRHRFDDELQVDDGNLLEMKVEDGLEVEALTKSKISNGSDALKKSKIGKLNETEVDELNETEVDDGLEVAGLTKSKISGGLEIDDLQNSAMTKSKISNQLLEVGDNEVDSQVEGLRTTRGVKSKIKEEPKTGVQKNGKLSETIDPSRGDTEGTSCSQKQRLCSRK
jgi:hypothetical protein